MGCGLGLPCLAPASDQTSTPGLTVWPPHPSQPTETIPHPPETTCFYLPAATHLEPLSFTLCPPSLSPMTPPRPLLGFSARLLLHSVPLLWTVHCLALKRQLTWPLVGRGHACTSL